MNYFYYFELFLVIFVIMEFFSGASSHPVNNNITINGTASKLENIQLKFLFSH